MRLIDADAAIESLTEYGNGRAVYIGVEEAVRRIEQLPSAEPDTTTHGSNAVKKGGNDEDRTSGDLISRQQAIDALKTDMASLDHIIKGMSAYDVRLDAYVSQRNQVNFDIDTISNLPPAQPEQRWILCSERLPEEGEVVLTQAKFKDDVKMAVSSRIDYNYWTTWGTRDINIVAWMPLPERYQERNEDT